ncbi:MAG: hypothetical protein M5R40_21450 [Anaerolineae bacterium]|nr:hypothetical protein [Anaerolineae bacterium]
MRVDDHVHVAALAAVAAGRPAMRHVLLTPESDQPVAAVAALYENPGLIHKHSGGRIPELRKAVKMGGAA